MSYGYTIFNPNRKEISTRVRGDQRDAVDALIDIIVTKVRYDSIDEEKRNLTYDEAVNSLKMAELRQYLSDFGVLAMDILIDGSDLYTTSLYVVHKMTKTLKFDTYTPRNLREFKNEILNLLYKFIIYIINAGVL